VGLESILTNYFHAPIHIEKCYGRWRSLTKSQYTRIGQKGQWQRLGQGATLGTRAWDQQNHFHIHLGPLTTEQLDLLLPSGKGFLRLKDLVKLYAGPSMDFSLSYSAKAPPSTLLQEKSYLGWRSWLGTSLLSGDEVRIGK
jgi:type VI secretion system protein ImpH